MGIKLLDVILHIRIAQRENIFLELTKVWDI